METRVSATTLACGHHGIDCSRCLYDVGSIGLFRSVTRHGGLVKDVGIDVQVDGVALLRQSLDGCLRSFAWGIGSNSGNDMTFIPDIRSADNAEPDIDSRFRGGVPPCT